ncbi:hypothetical protein PLEOSDRAFT_1087884 [Pleurotus ostreatus PC15]|uniref:Uncharacterized protein n=1 Tax=Pleurotus ostreatus (strain PC15) TaxID=1137138 RepID=A0A067NZU5_PLEO1|nr:hypothetical protein PLEOSDRAFT_1087884 [Pleurotus ostreatus PC15]
MVGPKPEQLSSRILVDGGAAGRPNFKLPLPTASSLRHLVDWLHHGLGEDAWCQPLYLGLHLET